MLPAPEADLRKTCSQQEREAGSHESMAVPRHGSHLFNWYDEIDLGML